MLKVVEFNGLFVVTSGKLVDAVDTFNSRYVARICAGYLNIHGRNVYPGIAHAFIAADGGDEDAIEGYADCVYDRAAELAASY